MKKLVLFFLFVFITTYSQTNKFFYITYRESNENSFNVVSKKGELYIDLDNQITCYIEGKPTVNNNSNLRGIIFAKNNFKEHKENQIFLYTDFKEKKLYNKLPDDANNWYTVTEAIPKFDWNLTDETKTTKGNKVLHKATANFRGRKYEAWYSLDFPFQYGPWKFSGLPGLIFEITGHSDIGDYTWHLSEIKVINKNDFKPVRDIDKNLISLKEFINKSESNSLGETNSDKVKKESDLDLEIESDSTYIQRIGAELIYEWEK